MFVSQCTEQDVCQSVMTVMRELMLVCWSTRRSLGLALLALSAVLAMNGSLMAKRLDGDLLPPKGAGSAKLETKSIMMQVYTRKLSRQASGKHCKEARKCMVKEREPLAMARALAAVKRDLSSRQKRPIFGPLAMARWALPALKRACSVGLILGAAACMPHRCVSLCRACASLAC